MDGMDWPWDPGQNKPKSHENPIRSPGFRDRHSGIVVSPPGGPVRPWDGNRRKKEKEPARHGRKRLKIVLVMLRLTDIRETLCTVALPHQRRKNCQTVYKSRITHVLNSFHSIRRKWLKIAAISEDAAKTNA